MHGQEAVGFANDVAVSLEKTTFAKYQTADAGYADKMRSLILNLKKPENKKIREKIVSGEMTYTQLISMSGEDLAPQSVKEHRKEVEKKLQQDRMLPDKLEVIAKNHKGEVTFLMGATSDQEASQDSVKDDSSSTVTPQTASRDPSPEEEKSYKIKRDLTRMDKELVDFLEGLDLGDIEKALKAGIVKQGKDRTKARLNQIFETALNNMKAMT